MNNLESTKSSAVPFNDEFMEEMRSQVRDGECNAFNISFVFEPRENCPVRGGKLLISDVDPGDTVAQVKKRLCDVYLFDYDTLSISYEGQDLIDPLSLSDFPAIAKSADGNVELVVNWGPLLNLSMTASSSVSTSRPNSAEYTAASMSASSQPLLPGSVGIHHRLVFDSEAEAEAEADGVELKIRKETSTVLDADETSQPPSILMGPNINSGNKDRARDDCCCCVVM